MNRDCELFDYIYDGICIIDSEYKILYWNNSLENLTGIDREEILNQYLTDRFPVFNHPRYSLRIDLLFSEGTPVLISTQLNETIFDRKERDSEIFQEITISRIPSGKESEYYAILNVKDITELSNRINDFRVEHNMLVKEIKQRKHLETKLRKSLVEKEILIKEVHHRVKNNLMLIVSLINMQALQIKEEKTISIFNDLKKRVESIALIHEKLYRGKDLVSISSEEYINDLLENIKNSLVFDEKQIKFITKTGDIKLEIETIIPLGLIITEIVTNSLKHAFRNNNEGEIIVELTNQQNNYKLLISDTGPGFPEDFDESKLDSLGWLLIKSLSSQLMGKHEIKNDGGAVHIIKFPIHPSTKSL